MNEQSRFAKRTLVLAGAATASLLLIVALMLDSFDRSANATETVLGIPGWVFVSLLAITTATALALFWSERQAPEKLLKTLAVLAIITFALGFTSFLGCSGGQTRVLAPWTWSLLLFAGEFEGAPFDEGGVCDGPVPLALQVARLLAITVTFAAVVLATLRLWRQALEKALLRWRSSVDIVIGVNPLSEPLIELLIERAGKINDAVGHPIDAQPDAEGERSDRPEEPRQQRAKWWNWAHERRVVVLDRAVDASTAQRLAALGAVVIEGDGLEESLLRRMIGYQGQRAAHRIYFMDDSAKRNRAMSLLAREILTTLGKGDIDAPGAEMPTRLRSTERRGAKLRRRVPVHTLVTARIDDPREAESWRIDHAVPNDPNDLSLILDALCPMEVTAEMIARFIEARDIRNVALIGDGPLFVALLSELVWRRGRRHVLRGPLGELSIAAWGAPSDAAEEWDLVRGRLVEEARDPHTLRWRLTPGQEPLSRELPAVFQDGRPDIIVFLAAHDPLVREKANRLSKLTSQSFIFVPSADAVGIVPIHGRQYLYGGSSVLKATGDRLNQLGIGVPQHGAPAGHIPRVRWERLARLQHDSWLPYSPGQVPWTALSPREKRENTAVTRQFLFEVARSGYQWVPDGVLPDAVLDPGLIDRLARLEHERWMAQKLSEDPPWKWGPVRNPEKRENPDLKDWDQLDDTSQKEKNRVLVREQQNRARLLGMHAVTRQALEGNTAQTPNQIRT